MTEGGELECHVAAAVFRLKLRCRRVVRACAMAEKAESGGSEVLESVFSAAALPVPFYQDLIRGHAAKAVWIWPPAQETLQKRLFWRGSHTMPSR